MLCNDYEFKKTKQFRDLKWESKKAFNKCLDEIRRTGKFIINLNDVLDLIQEVKKIIKKTISTGADKNIKQKLSQKIDYSNLDDKWIEHILRLLEERGYFAGKDVNHKNWANEYYKNLIAAYQNGKIKKTK